VLTNLVEKNICLEEIGEGLWRMCFRQKMLVNFDEATLRWQDDRDCLKRNKV